MEVFNVISFQSKNIHSFLKINRIVIILRVLRMNDFLIQKLLFKIFMS